jgi:NhaP-type Na+/H+ or K+/H+ antiporter
MYANALFFSLSPYPLIIKHTRYFPYFVAETVEMSGIVATLFAGIATRHYAHGNLNVESQAQVCL